MAEVLKRRRLVNPGHRSANKRRVNPARARRRKRSGHKRMTAKQIKYFGTARQKAALRSSHRRRANPARRRTRARRRNAGIASTVGRAWNRLTRRPKITRRKVSRRHKRRPLANIGEIITVGLNPGRRISSMARRRKRSRAVGTHRRRVVRRRRRVAVANPHFARRHRRRNPGLRRRHHYRRNPGVFSGVALNVAGVIGGAAITKLVTDQLPTSYQSGIMGYAATGIVAAVLGWGTGKFAKKPALGMALMLGGMTYLALKILNDFVPSIAAYSPFGLKGMGMIGPSSFYTPQVNRAGNMGAFQVPSAVTGAIAASMPAQTALRGLGRRGVRVGRMA